MSGAYSGPGFIRLRGQTVLKVAKISFTVDTGNTDVDLLLEGRDGHNRGPVKVMVAVEGAIPQNGLLVDWPSIAAAGQQVALDFVLAGQTRQCEGDIRGAEESTTTTGNAWTMSFAGRWLNPNTGA